MSDAGARTPKHCDKRESRKSEIRNQCSAVADIGLSIKGDVGQTSFPALVSVQRIKNRAVDRPRLRLHLETRSDNREI